MTRLLTEERLDTIRANHDLVDSDERSWDGADEPHTAVLAFEDRADLLDEVEAWQGLMSVLAKEVAEKRIVSIDYFGDYHKGRVSAFTEVLRILAPRVTPEDFETVAELVKAVSKDPR